MYHFARLSTPAAAAVGARCTRRRRERGRAAECACGPYSARNASDRQRAHPFP